MIWLWVDVVRYANLIVGVCLLVALVWRYHRHKHRYTSRLKDFWWLVFVFVLTTVAGTVENLFFDSSFRVIMVSFALYLTVRLLFGKTSGEDRVDRYNNNVKDF